MPEPIDLGFVVTLPPADAVAFFRSKGYAISWDWEDVWQEAQARAFTVARVNRLEVLQSIRNAVDRAINEGRTAREFAHNLEPELRRLGWWGRETLINPQGIEQTVTLGTPWRLRNIYRINLQSAYMAGRWKRQREGVRRRPYWQYVTARDDAVRPGHRALHNRVFRWDDPFWDSHYPPNGWGCRCRVRALTERQVEARGLTVETSAGKLSEQLQLVSQRTGELRPGVGFAAFTPGEGEMLVIPDAGWSVNPGKVRFEADLKRYDRSLREQFRRHQPPPEA